MAKRFDVVVVGSGAAGGMAARCLTEAGLEVLVLEAGPDRTAPGGDHPDGDRSSGEVSSDGLLKQLKSRAAQFEVLGEVMGRVQSDVAAALLGQPSLQSMIHLRERSPRLDYPRQPIQVESPAFSRDCSMLYTDDVDNPYLAPSSQPYHWIRGRQLGGRTQIWKRMTPRLTDSELKAPLRDGVGEPWPLDEQTLTPHYEAAERVLRVVGAVEAGAPAYDGALSNRALSPLESAVATSIRALRPTASVILAPYASPFGPNEEGDLDRRVDQYDQGGHPAHDCSVRHSLWHAQKSGRLTVRCDAVVSALSYDKGRGRVRGVQFIDRLTLKEEEVEAKVVLLAASALESTRILLNSKSSAWPQGLANSSGVLGHYLHDHMFGVGAVGIKAAPGQSESFPPLLIPSFRNRAGAKPFAGFHRGYQTAGYVGAMRAGPMRRWQQTLVLSSHGEVTPRRENRIEIDSSVKDAWGIAVPKVFFSRNENDRAMCRDMLATAEEMLEASGYEVILSSPEPLPPGASIHEGGTVRMGQNPETSVLNRHAQSWDVPNLFVTDGAAFTTAAHQNPMLSIMAITSLACGYLTHELKSGRL